MDNEFLARLQGLLLDLDGVVYRGLIPLPGADRLSATLGRLGVPYAFVTNNATLTPRQFQARLAHMGVPARARQVVTSPQATAAYLRTVAPPGTSVYVVGEHGLRQALASAGFVVDGPEPRYVVVGLDRKATYARLARACQHVLHGATLVGTNADRAIPVEDGLAPGAGSLLGVIVAVTSVTPIVIGKPEPTLVQVALDRIGVPADRAAMVGDQIETDIRAGRAAGTGTILIEGDLARSRSDVHPDLIVRDLADLLDRLEAARR